MISASRVTTSPTTTTKYVFAGTGAGAVLETDAANTVKLFNREGPLGVWYRVIGDPITGTKEHVWPSPHGDLAATSDTGGVRTGAFTYSEFGEPDQALPTDATSEPWTGQYRKQTDSASGLTLMGARPYDTTTGRFQSVDPIEGGSCNAYDYVCQDPENSFDLDGTHVSVPGPTFYRSARRGAKEEASIVGPAGTNYQCRRGHPVLVGGDIWASR